MLKRQKKSEEAKRLIKRTMGQHDGEETGGDAGRPLRGEEEMRERLLRKKLRAGADRRRSSGNDDADRRGSRGGDRDREDGGRRGGEDRKSVV